MAGDSIAPVDSATTCSSVGASVSSSGCSRAFDEGPDLLALADAEIARGVERVAVLGERSKDLVAERLRELAQLRQRGVELEVGHMGQMDGGDRCQFGCFVDVDRHTRVLSRRELP